LKPVDGSGSDLDADLLDGSHASAFSDVNHNHDSSYPLIYLPPVSQFYQADPSFYEAWSPPLTTAIARTANYLQGHPITLWRYLTLDKVGLRVSIAGAAGAKARIGIYTNYAAGVYYPDQLVYDFGEVSIDTTGTKTKSYVLTLPAGIYWLCMACSADTSFGGPYHPIFSNVALSNPVRGIEVAFSYAALPTTFPLLGAISIAIAGVALRRVG
jgi:hypothetical protein